MNISFFLLPKSEVVYIRNSDTVGDALKLLHKTRYQTVPVIDREGKYVGTISEGDFLWNLIVDYDSNTEAIKKTPIEMLHKKCYYKPVSIEANISELDKHILDQNFVPVVDGRDVFIGIVTRREIIKALLEKRKERS